MNDLITPFKIERTCHRAPDLEQLVLKKVDNAESVFTRMLVKLRNAGLPTSQYVSEFATPETLGENSYPWDLFLVLKYRQDWRPSGYGLGDLILSHEPLGPLGIPLCPSPLAGRSRDAAGLRLLRPEHRSSARL